MFDYRAAALRNGISDADLERICRLVRTEFPHDEMLFELHVLRAILAIEHGYTTLPEVLGERAGLSAN
jgi:hypothetical protein